MPIYTDTHKGTTDLPPALRKLVTDRVHSSERDEHGVMDKGIVMDQDGQKLPASSTRPTSTP